MLGLDSVTGNTLGDSTTLGGENQAQNQNRPPWDVELNDVWGLVWNDSSPSLLAASSRHKIFVLDASLRSKEEPITASAHLVSFTGLELTGVYLDEMVMYGEPRPGAVRVFDSQPLRELKEVLYGGGEAVTLLE